MITAKVRAALCAVLLGATAGPLVARAATTPDVTVTLGQALQDKSGDFGGDQVQGLTRDLADVVGRAIARSNHTGTPVRLQLVLEDATPNRPTPAELGRNAGLSYGSIGLGGAWIDGTAFMADGRKVSLGFSFYETNLSNEFGPSTWSDAKRAFDMLARRLARGDIPQKAAPNAAANSGFAHFPS